jgi:hypothetical protein
LPKERSVDEDVDAFCGWDFLRALVKKAQTPFMAGLIAALFETGGRISEVLGQSHPYRVEPLRKRNVVQTLHPDVVVIRQMPVIKRFEKVGDSQKWKCLCGCNRRWSSKPSPEEFKRHNIKEYAGWVTKPILDYRTFPIRKDEPLTAPFIDWVKTVRRESDPLFQIERSAAFVRVRKVGEALNMKIPFTKIHSSQIYDHFFRAERACQLAFDYGFQRDDLRAFFCWKERKPDMAERYASLGWIGLAKKMGVKV